ncbi:MAG: hypothetical protein HRT36_02475 [Alphaproteobacteria bacterium]|nr:hypothetical protein [Alphaproteobacteria bacterium]
MILLIAVLLTSAELYLFGEFRVINWHGDYWSDWRWLWWRIADGLPISPWIEYSPVLLLGVLGLGLCALEKCTIRAGNRTIHGLHGNARWASTAEVKRAGLLDQGDGGVVRGRRLWR